MVVSEDRVKFAAESYKAPGIVLPTDKPKDFINRLLNDSASQQVQSPYGQQKSQTQKPETAPQQVTVQPADPLKEVVDTVKKEVMPEFDFEKKEEPKLETKAETKTETEVSDTVEAGSIAENYKLLKSKFKEVKTEAQRIAEEKAAIAKKLEEYETGAVVPDLLQQKENEIARLSAYEKMFNFKGSKAYQEQFVKPLSQNAEQLKAIFKDYEIPEEVLSQVEGVSNRAERNRFLSEHFDPVGAEEVKRLLESRQELRTRAKDIEAGSTDFIRNVEEEQKRIDAAREVERKSNIAGKAKEAWLQSLLQVKQENKTPELVLSDTDEERNAKVVRPILTQAATAYGKLVTYLAENGIKELPDDLGRALARMALLSHASAFAIHSRDSVLKHAEAAEEGTRIGNGYFRPAIGGGMPSISGASSAAPKPTLEQGMDSVLNNVLSKRK
jgi:hypothetical protein